MLTALSTVINVDLLRAEAEEIGKPSSLPISSLSDEQRKPEIVGRPGIDDYSAPSMANITNVFQLRDISPRDWAYEALQSLIERYGCLVGYPDQSFRGERPLTRLEFAAGLNACLNTLERLLQQNVNVSKEDLEKLEQLTQEFTSELATLGRRVEELEARTAFLENHQFSTTSKLFGSLRVQTNAYFSGEGQDGRPQVNMQYNMFLATITSFTGRDSLVTGLGITNTRFAELANTNDGRDVGSTREGASDTTDSGDTGGSARLITLQYLFPVDERLNINIIAANRFRFDPVLLSQFVPYYRLGGGPASTFASAPPIYLVGGGSGANVNYKLFDSTVLNLTYFSTFANEPNPAKGLFNGDYVMVAQINYNPTPSLFLQLLYQKGYFGPGNFGFNNGQTFRGNGFVGTALANRFDDAGVLFEEASAVSSNAYLIGGYYAITPKVVVGGWANLINARLLGKGDADIWTYSAQVAFPDLFKEGNQGGLIVGVEPMLTSLQSEIPYANFKNDTSLHIEAYYKYMVNNNFSITPSLIWITAPNQDADNRDIIVGGIRTTFDF
jgi:hypothetical protein